MRLGARLLQRKALAQWRETVVRLLVLDGVLWGLWLLCETVLGLHTSRRLVRHDDAVRRGQPEEP